MTSAFLGLALLLLIASLTVILGALTRLLASAIAGPASREDDRPLTIADRVALGNELIARDLSPDDLHPVARTSPRGPSAGRSDGTVPFDGPVQRQDLAVRYPAVAAHALR